MMKKRTVKPTINKKGNKQKKGIGGKQNENEKRAETKYRDLQI
jgi:hypothetical protein